MTLGAALLLLLPAGATPDGAGAPDGGERKLALLISNNEGFDGTVALRFVTEDVRKTREVLERQGGYHRLDVYEVERATPEYLRTKIKEIGFRVRALQERGVRVSLYVYYSGHADAEQLQLGTRGLAWGELKSWLAAAGADQNLLVVDACGSGGLFAAKGLTPVDGPLPALAEGLEAPDFAIVTSATRDQAARESRELQSSLFTHFFTHGQWGDADDDRDGAVTLGESFTYAADWVDRWARHNPIGPQDPQLRGARDLVVAEAGGDAGELVLTPGASGSFRVYDARTGALVLPVETVPEPVALALPPGRYLVHREAAFGAARAEVTLAPGESATLHPDDFELGWEDDRLKGWMVTARRKAAILDLSVSALAGVTAWADPDVSSTWFPAAATGGLQARVAWPSGLYWTADAWGAYGARGVGAEGDARAADWRRVQVRAGGLGLGAGAMTRGPTVRVGGGLHVQTFALDRRYAQDPWSAADDDPATAPLLLPAPGAAGFVGLRDGRAELELHLRSHFLPYSIEPGADRRDNVGSTEALLTLGWRL